MIKGIWITRDEGEAGMWAWLGEPEYGDGEWGGGGDNLSIPCDQGHMFIQKLLGDAWRSTGAFGCVITVRSIERLVSEHEEVASKLRKLTKANFRKAPIAEAIKLLEAVGD